MSNIVMLQERRQSILSVPSQLLAGFATQRRDMNDVFWLKENAELLGIFAAIGKPCSAADLEPYALFYRTIEERLGFFPQYYRFLLSICLDLEDLGMEGDLGLRLCRKVMADGLPEAELSDLQRAEARRLLRRRGVSVPVDHGELGDRLHAFTERSATFAIPNRKAAYELTHVIFYLTEYGARRAEISDEAIVSLEYAGLLAFLDQNIDLLAEICLALRFAGAQPSEIWQRAVTARRQLIQPVGDVALPLEDACHEYLVTEWASHRQYKPAFDKPVPQGPLRFARRQTQSGVLRSLSQSLYDLAEYRSGDWQYMRLQVMPDLGEHAHDLVLDAERSTDRFDAFFEQFARASPVG